MIEYDELNGNASCTQPRYLAQQRILRGHGFIVKEELSVEQSASTAHVLPLDEINSLWKRKSEELSEADAMTAPDTLPWGAYLAYFASAYHTSREHQRRVYLTKRRSSNFIVRKNTNIVSSSFTFFIFSNNLKRAKVPGKKPLMNDSPIKSRIRRSERQKIHKQRCA